MPRGRGAAVHKAGARRHAARQAGSAAAEVLAHLRRSRFQRSTSPKLRSCRGLGAEEVEGAGLRQKATLRAATCGLNRSRKGAGDAPPKLAKDYRSVHGAR